MGFTSSLRRLIPSCAPMDKGPVTSYQLRSVAPCWGGTEGKPMSGKTVFVTAVCMLFAGGLIKSQQPAANADSSQPGTLTVTVKVVNVPATVRDKHGQIIRTLSKDDFL